MSFPWQASASIENLRNRAQILSSIRQFFSSRNVMEVETPLLCRTSVTDPFIESIPATLKGTQENQNTLTFFLQTSPEYAMKRLLASGSGAIYQIAKAFRQGEIGRFHQPEFTMIEWYQPEFDHYDLMKEVDALLQFILKTKPADKKNYQELFQTFLGINPHHISINDLAICAKQHEINVEGEINDKDMWLNLLMSHCIEPYLGQEKPCFIYDFPASQAALARLRAGNPPLASRFEVYFKGLELANGFHELNDANEQRQRFERNLLHRKSLQLPLMEIDELFLSALSHLPDCSGVALGIDRLVMLATGSNDITEVVSFDWNKI